MHTAMGTHELLRPCAGVLLSRIHHVVLHARGELSSNSPPASNALHSMAERNRTGQLTAVTLQTPPWRRAAALEAHLSRKAMRLAHAHPPCKSATPSHPDTVGRSLTSYNALSPPLCLLHPLPGPPRTFSCAADVPRTASAIAASSRAAPRSAACASAGAHGSSTATCARGALPSAQGQPWQCVR